MSATVSGSVDVAHRAENRHVDGVLVGVDGTPAGEAALLWAAHEAAARGLTLTVAHAWVWVPIAPWTAGIDTDAIAQLRTHSASVLEHARAVVAERVGLEAHVVSLQGTPGDVLSEAGTSASTIVVGHNDVPALQRAVIASTGSSLAAHAAQPVVIARHTPADGAGTVVVAVAPDHQDGRLLTFAFDYARRHQLALKVVTCWHPPRTRPSASVPHEVHVCFSEYVSRWRDGYPDVRVTLGVRTDDPVHALVDESSRAELVVVGRHGRSRHLGALLGSVSRAMVFRAHCSVAVVPPSPDVDPAPAPGRPDAG